MDFGIDQGVIQPKLFPTFDGPKSSTIEFEDELLPACVEIFLAENRASTSLLQRRLRIGYTRAARLVDSWRRWASLLTKCRASRGR